MEEREQPKSKSTGPIHMNYGNESKPEGPGGLVSNAPSGSQRRISPGGPQGMDMAESAGDGYCDSGPRREHALGMLDRKIVELESKMCGLIALRKNLEGDLSPELEETLWRILQGEFRRM